MRVSRPLIYANITALTLNGVLVYLTIILTWSPLASFAVFTALLAGSGFLSYYAVYRPSRS